ncbi:MAG TPA: multicopper oxidase domain-containing protein [Anaerolineae bacterium]|nr:multicopper oxidase domain-containing protein [Anaerolineae bacterium]
MLDRRQFLKLSAAAGASVLVPWRLDLQRAFAQIPGGSLAPGDVQKYVLPLVKPPAMPGKDNPQKTRFRIAMRQFQQRIISPPHPETTVWSYGSIDHPGTVAQGGTFNYPALTIEATFGKPVEILWENGLVDGDGNYLPHLLPVDPTLHWANPPGGLMMRDMRPSFETTPGPYTGPVPMVTHVHGAHTGEESDGYAEAWFLPKAKNIPKDYATTGTFFDYFAKKYRVNSEPGTARFTYPNDQRATTLWYHDHTLGMTRLNVYAGPAGFYLIRGGPDDVVDGVLPGGAPGIGDDPLGTYYEIPIGIQDRSFNADGSLFYPDSRAFFDGYPGPYIPDTPVAPIWNPEFFGNMMVVNGFTWPFLEVERRRYRFRLLNGCNSRFLLLKMTQTPRTDNASFNAPEGTFWQIGAEGGFLPAAVPLQEILLAPAERADVIIDFSDFPVGAEVYLVNDGPDAPFGGITTDDIADWTSTGQVMKFVVGAGPAADPSSHPADLGLPAITPLGDPANVQALSLNEEMYEAADIPAAALLGRFDTGTGQTTPQLWMDPISENPATGSTEVWELHNLTEDAHPIHVHLVQFQVVGREPFGGGTSIAGSNDPLPGETGFKDTVIAYPREITRLKARFDTPGIFVWHCHIVEHEDNEMMRPFHVGPMPPDLPA